MKKPELSKEKIKGGLKRAMWLFMALLFVVTGLGVGVYAFWQGTHQDSDSSANTTNPLASAQPPTCTSDPALQIAGSTTAGGKLAGTELVNFTPIKTVTGLSCIDAKVGTGSATVQSTSTITVNYTGAVAASGKIFQSSLDNAGQPLTKALNDLIPGWQSGLLGMKAGGERRLLVPAALAYGPTPPANSGIPADADLVFDITVLAIQ